MRIPIGASIDVLRAAIALVAPSLHGCDEVVTDEGVSGAAEGIDIRVILLTKENVDVAVVTIEAVAALLEHLSSFLDHVLEVLSPTPLGMFRGGRAVGRLWLFSNVVHSGHISM